MPGNTSTAFEQEFSNMAHGFLQDTVPELIKHNIGFEIVEANEAKTDVTGVFGFKINGKNYIVPVKFVNNELKPMIMIVDVDDNTIDVLNSEQVAELKKSKPGKMGRADKINVKNSPHMNMRDFLVYPFTHKQASEDVSWIKKAYFDLKAKTASEIRSHIRNLGNIDKSSNVLTFIGRSNNHVKRAFLNMAEGHEDLWKKCVDIYGIGSIKKACLDNVTGIKVQAPSYEIIDIDSPHEKKAKLTMKEKVDLEHTDLVIRDCRDPKSINKTYDVFYNEHTYVTPNKTGIYHVATNKGFVKCAIFMNITHFHTKSIAPKRCIIVDMQSRSWCVYNPSHLVLANDIVEPIKDKDYMKLGSLHGNTDRSNYYILHEETTESEKVYEPFRIDTKTKSDKGTFYTVAPNPNFRENAVSCIDAATKEYPREYPHDEIQTGRSFDEAVIWIKDAGKINQFGVDIFAPKDAKVFSLKKQDLVIMGSVDIDSYTFEGFSIVKASSLGYSVDGRFHSFKTKRATVESMMNDLGIHGPTALMHIEKENEFHMRKSDLQKKAFGMFSDYSPAGLMQPITSPPNGEQTIDIRDFPAGNYNNMMPNLSPVQQLDSDDIAREIEMATMMAEKGMKNIFDHSLIGSLSKITDIYTNLRSHIPSIEKTIDSLGRIIFLMWDNYEEFAESFGINEVPEFESLLKETFSNLGDIKLHIQSKDIGKKQREII